MEPRINWKKKKNSQGLTKIDTKKISINRSGQYFTETDKIWKWDFAWGNKFLQRVKITARYNLKSPFFHITVYCEKEKKLQ